MKHWQTRPLGEVSEIFNGKTPAKSEQRATGHPVLKIKDVDENGNFRGKHSSFVDTDFSNAHGKKKVNEGDVLILNAAHNADYVASKVFFAGAEVSGAIATGEWTIIRANPASLNPGFVHHWVRSQSGRTAIKNLVRGIHLYPSDVASVKFAVPPLREQERIVKLLNGADQLQKLRAQAERRTATLLPSIFDEMFGDPVSNPKRWPIKPFGELASNQDGRRRPVKASDRAGRKGEYPYYGASGIIDYVEEYLFDETALLIGEDGANLLARSTPIAFLAHGKYWVNNHAHVVIENGNADLTYLCAALNLRDLTEYVTGSAQPKLNQANLNRMPFPVPPLPLQEEFAQRVSEIRELEADQAASGRRLKQLFQSLLHDTYVGAIVD